LEQGGWRPALFREMIADGAAISDEVLSEHQAAVSPSDPAILMYTSGTTGLPKGALLSHYSLVNNAMLYLEVTAPFWQREGVARKDYRNCCLLPFFHVAGLSNLIVGVLAGGTICPLLAFDPVKAMQTIEQERCNNTFAMPTMLLAILQHADVERYDLSSLLSVGSGGTPVPISLMERTKACIGSDIWVGFGQTEGSCTLTLSRAEDSFEQKSATVGRPIPHIEVKISDPVTDAVVPVGAHGELCYRGFVTMLGYYKMPEQTAEAIDADGWLHSGDLATMNEQGYLNIVGRLKDMVIRGGENLFPAEIEAFLIRHPNVVNVQVVGVPDAFFGEELLAVVIPRAGEQLSEQELRDYCRGQISHQKIPRYFQFVASYPLTASGKVQKFVLREQAIKALGLEEVAKVQTA